MLTNRMGYFLSTFNDINDGNNNDRKYIYNYNIKLDLNTCSLSGNIPNFGNMPSLSVINLSSNQLSGELPVCYTYHLPSLSLLTNHFYNK